VDNFINFLREYWIILIPVAILLVGVLVYLQKKGMLKKISLAGIEVEFDSQTAKMDRFQLFARSDSTEFAQRFESLARQADRIVLIGTGINILQRDPLLLDLLERVVQRKCTLEIYLANPFSRQVQSRLIEEEIGNIKPPVGRQGLIQRLETMLEKQKELGDPPNFSLQVFSNYPTLAMFIIDTEYFLYPYGYTLLGNLSPVMQFSRNRPGDRPMIDFMEGQYQRIKAGSVDARLVMDVHHRRKVATERLVPFAAYLIPPAESALYRFGSEVLGYDVHENRQIASPFALWVGDAGDFGFHVTVADALYMYSQRDVDLLQKEIEFLLQGLPPIPLKLTLSEGFPNRSSVSLTLENENGVLEYLHHELVSCCYRTAAGSNYDLGLVSTDRGGASERTRLMIQHYHAPYVLSSFRPHFTLLTNLPAEDAGRRKLLEQLRQMYEERVPEQEIELHELYLMRRPQPNRPWQVARELVIG
jgi:hypothetical protein